MKTLMVTGSRTWTDYDVMEQALGNAYLELGGSLELRGGVTLIGGNAKGADQLAESIWQEKVGELWISRYPANGQPLARNDRMLSLRPDLLVAFQNYCNRPQCPQQATYGLTHGTHGTAYTINKAHRAGIPTRIFTRGS